ncbi:hypothetical protein MKX54_02900 [Alkalihalobacillus sp. FSL R5-0424]
MRNLLMIGFASLLSRGFLIACSDDSSTVERSETEQEETQADESYGMPEKQETEEENHNDKEESETSLEEDTPQDQVDLNIGDSGLIETASDKFKIKLNNVELTKNIEGIQPVENFDQFLLTNVTIINEHTEKIVLEDVIDIFEVTVLLEGSGYQEASGLYDIELDGFSGDLTPGDSVTGDLLFQTVQSENHYLRVTEGLIAASGVKNQVVWSFTEDELDR